MSEEFRIPADKLPAMVQHLSEVLNVVQDANNALVSKLTALPNFPDEALDVLNQWSTAINETHTASDLFVTGLQTGNKAPSLQ